MSTDSERIAKIIWERAHDLFKNKLTQFIEMCKPGLVANDFEALIIEQKAQYIASLVFAKFCEGHYSDEENKIIDNAATEMWSFLSKSGQPNTLKIEDRTNIIAKPTSKLLN